MGSSKERAKIEVIALVASAGGLEALSAVIHDLPADLPTAVVVQQHLTVPASGLIELLGRRTRREVVWAVDGAVVGSGRVSVCPPGMRMEILPDGTCLLAARERYGDQPHDLLLASLADSYGPRSLAVVLTGGGSDGAAGTAALKAAGGVIIAQSEDTAEHPSTPRAAAEAGADLVLPLYEIAGVVADIVRGRPLPRPHEEAQAVRAVFGDVGEAAALARDVDWASTPLGSVGEWSEATRTVVRMGMDSTDPVAMWLGESEIFLCNDAAIRKLGGKRFAAAFGRPPLEADPEVWDQADPLFARVMVGEGIHQSATFALREPDGKIEYGWYDRTVTPIRERGGTVAGVYQVWVERTAEVLAARRLQTLSRLAATAGRDRQEALQSALAVLDEAADVPFAAAYLLDGSTERVGLAGAVGIAEDGTMAPAVLRVAPGSGWPLYQVIEQRHPVLVDDVAVRFRGQLVGSEQLVPECAVLCPLRDEAEDRVIGVLVLGAHPRLPVDERYREFLALAGEMVSARVAESRAWQRERQRLERLAELDQAKTEFFSNVSHEFRTPLTLMLAPLEEIVRRSPELPTGMAAEVELVQRNARRLLRLVGTLLDLSPAEAGRLRARFALTDLAGLTAEVTSAFRSAAEAAGLQLTVGAPPLPEPVWVDAGMWEKIVSNLVSNALKFTWEGGIEVSLRALSRHAELVVRDSGVGIPADELPFAFKRFHRAREARGRTQEGAGTGLALVDGLVRLHHGRVRATSVEGVGTTVTVWVPLKQRPSPEQGASGPVRTGDLAAAMAAEAARWDADREQAQAALGLDDGTVPLAELRRRATGARIVVADGNPDMRDYLTRLLSSAWDVEAACDGTEALMRIRRHPPDLILADVMLPGLDGFALLRAIHADQALAVIPVVLVTARAGEENAIEGLLAGADDYVVKPFSARELLARVGAQLELSRVRLRAAEADAFRVRLIDALRAAADGREAEMRATLLLLEHLRCARVSYGEFEDGFTLAVHAAATSDGVAAETSRWDLTRWHTPEARADLEAGRPVVIEDVRSDPRIPALTQASYADRDVASLVQAPVVKDGQLVAMLLAQDSATRQWRDDEVSLVADTGDRTWQAIQRGRAELALRESEARLRSLIEASFDVVYRMSPDWTQMRTLMGRGFLADTVDPSTTWLGEYIDVQDRPMVLAAIQHAIGTRSVFELEHRVKRPDGTLGWTLSRAMPLLGDDGEIVEWIGTATDVTARHDASQRLAESEE